MEILLESNSKMSKALIDRYFCHYEKLEEYQKGMWRRIPPKDFDQATKKARSLMMDVGLFSESMGVVIDTWSNSCKVAFTTPSVNPIAWLGQASVCEALGVPESATRAAWGQLPLRTQIQANNAARLHIDGWMKKQIGQGELFGE